MGALTLCTGNGCPLRDDCVRYSGRTVERYQSWMTAPYDSMGCTYMIRRERRK